MSRDFKHLDELTKIDEKHLLVSQLTGRLVALDRLYQAVESIQLNATVPEDIRGQFNVAKNMALYTYFFYDLAPEVQHKTYTVIELALRQRAGSSKRMTLRSLVERAVSDGWIRDSGFRNIENPLPANPYCQSLIKILPELRNSSAHGSTALMPGTVKHLEICADLINQLFQPESTNAGNSTTGE